MTDTVKKENAVSIGEFLYLAFFTVLTAGKAVGLYDGMPAFNAIMVIAVLLLGAKLLTTRYTVLEWVLMLLAVAVSLLVYRNTGEKGLFIDVLLVIGMKGVNVRRVFRAGLILWTACFAGLIFLTQTGILAESYVMHEKHGIGFMMCHACGYSHSNVFHVTYVIIGAFFVYLLYDCSRRSKRIFAALYLAGDIFVFILSGSFTGLLGGFFLTFLFLYFSCRGTLSGPEKALVLLFEPFCLVLAIVGPLVLKGRAFDIVNKLLTTRYSLSRYFLTKQPITPFGTRFVLTDYRYTMDSAWVYLFMQYGVVPFVIIAVLFFLLICDLVKKGKKAEIVITLALCFAGITEPFLFNNSARNLVLLFLGDFLFTFAAAHPAVGLFGREVCLLPADTCRIPARFLLLDRLGAALRRIAAGIVRAPGRMAAAFVIAVLVSAGVYAAAGHFPEKIYINEENNQNHELAPQYLTEEEAAGIRAAGDLLVEYEGSGTAMYAYEGSAPAMYKLQRIACCGIFSGIAAVFVVYFVEEKRKKKIL